MVTVSIQRSTDFTYLKPNETDTRKHAPDEIFDHNYFVQRLLSANTSCRVIRARKRLFSLSASAFALGGFALTCGCYTTEVVYAQWYTNSTWWQSLQFSLHSQSASSSASGIGMGQLCKACLNQQFSLIIPLLFCLTP